MANYILNEVTRNDLKIGQVWYSEILLEIADINFLENTVEYITMDCDGSLTMFIESIDRFLVWIYPEDLKYCYNDYIENIELYRDIEKQIEDYVYSENEKAIGYYLDNSAFAMRYYKMFYYNELQPSDNIISWLNGRNKYMGLEY